MNKKQTLYKSALEYGLNNPAPKTHHADQSAKLAAFNAQSFEGADFPWWSSLVDFARANLAAHETQKAPSEIAAQHAEPPAA